MSDKTHLVSSLPSMEQTIYNQSHMFAFKRKVATLKYSLKIFLQLVIMQIAHISFIKTRTIK